MFCRWQLTRCTMFYCLSTEAGWSTFARSVRTTFISVLHNMTSTMLAPRGAGVPPFSPFFSFVHVKLQLSNSYCASPLCIVLNSQHTMDAVGYDTSTAFHLFQRCSPWDCGIGLETAWDRNFAVLVLEVVVLVLKNRSWLFSRPVNSLLARMNCNIIIPCSAS